MKRVLAILIVIALVSVGYYWWTTQQGTETIGFSSSVPDSRITGSGTIEAEIVAITSETGGRIIAMHADEGDEVYQNDRLVELDTSLLQAQRNQLEASLATARANLAEVNAPPRPEAVAAAEAELEQAKTARDGAYAVWQQTQSIVSNPIELNAQIDAMRGQIAVLEKQVEAAEATLKTAEIQRDEAARNQSNDEAVTLSQIAAKQAEAARANLVAAQTEVAGARSQLNLLIAMRDKPLVLITQANAAESAYELTEAAILVAEAKLASVKAGAMEEDVAIAQAQVKQAEASLASLDVLLGKLRLAAPRDGIITERQANPGELAAPGATLMSLGDLGQVTLTVFIPETQIGRVRLGQTARVNVDAYSGETFEGVVTFIAPEAEFTPKNVQTEEERVNLVFAVKISLDNPEHRLKPGMPADAEIISDL